MDCITDRLTVLKDDLFLTGGKSLVMTVLGVVKTTASILTAGCITDSCGKQLDPDENLYSLRESAGDLTFAIPDTLLKLVNPEYSTDDSYFKKSIHKCATSSLVKLADSLWGADGFLKEHIFTRCVHFAKLIVDTISHIADFIIGALAFVPALLTAGKVNTLNHLVENGWRAPGEMIADIFKGVMLIIKPDYLSVEAILYH